MTKVLVINKGEMKMKKGNLRHQGDVIVHRIDALPSTAIKQEVKGAIILALGEVTGHKHQIAKPTGVNLWVDADRRFLEVCAAIGTEIVHEEHGTMPAEVLQPGIYEFGQYAEYSPAAIRSVMD